MTKKFLYVILLVISGCSHEHLDKEAYVEFFNNPKNQLNHSFKTDNWIYSVQFRNPEIMTLIELQNIEFSEQEFLAACKEYEDMEYYFFSFKKLNNKGSLKSNTDSLLNEFSFGFQNHLFLITESDTLKPGLFHFENMIGKGTEFRFMTAFPAQPNVGRTFYIDRFFEDTNIKLRLSQVSISNIPKLKL